MTNKKLTNKTTLEMAIECVKANNYHSAEFTTNEIVEKLEKMLATVEKKNSTNKKPTEKQKENDSYKKLILEFLSEQEEPKTVTEMIKAIPEISEFTNQKVSAIVKQLKDDEKVVKTVVKGRAVFALAE